MAERLAELLHLRASRSFVQIAGQYRGYGRPFDLNALSEHLRGETTIAFGAVSGISKRALFAAVDIDSEFETLVPHLWQIYENVGGQPLLDATFLTDGSGCGRGKIVTAFSEPMPADDARRFAHLVEKRVRATDPGRGIPHEAITTFPQRGSGGRLRVLGMNPRRRGPLESAFTLDGEPQPHLDRVTPISVAAFQAIYLQATTPPFVDRLLKRPWIREEKTNVHFGRMCRLAEEALRISAETAGRVQYDRWLETVRRNSPELQLPSLRNGDRRCILDHGRERAWKSAFASKFEWVPQNVEHVSPAVARLYSGLCYLVEERGLRYVAFSLDYASVAAVTGVSKPRAYLLVRRAEELDLLVRHHCGTKDAPGAKGLCTIYGLVGHGETPAHVLARGALDSAVRERACRVKVSATLVAPARIKPRIDQPKDASLAPARPLGRTHALPTNPSDVIPDETGRAEIPL